MKIVNRKNGKDRKMRILFVLIFQVKEKLKRYRMQGFEDSRGQGKERYAQLLINNRGGAKTQRKGVFPEGKIKNSLRLCVFAVKNINHVRSTP